MQNAQIWRSIKALSDEAETIARSGTPMMAVIKSTPPPVTSDLDDTPTKTNHQRATVLQSTEAPPPVILEKRNRTNKQDNTIDPEGTLTPATMADIAAAIEQVGKTVSKPMQTASDSAVSDEIRQQMIAEISQSVRMVLANELPNMVRHAVSASLYELLTTNNPAPPANGSLTKAAHKPAAKKRKPAKTATAKKVLAKQNTVKKAPTKRASAKKAGAKAPVTKQATVKKAQPKKTRAKKPSP